jgi:hypothetical protein
LEERDTQKETASGVESIAVFFGQLEEKQKVKPIVFIICVIDAMNNGKFIGIVIIPKVKN